MFIPVTIASAFLNNTPIVALLIPCASAALHAFCPQLLSPASGGTNHCCAMLAVAVNVLHTAVLHIISSEHECLRSRSACSIIIAWSRRAGVSPKKLLIPLSYGAVFGGTCTLIGTSTNLVISSELLPTKSGGCSHYLPADQWPLD